MCGFVWALSIWMWERLPVGRPEKDTRRPWMDYGEEGDLARCPTAAYAWDKVKVYTGKASALYKVFTNELDNLTAYQVNWWPYHDREWGFELNKMCYEGRLAWRCIVPMICVYAVEWHLPQRVATQFGMFQNTPPARPNDTGGFDLHWKSRQHCQSITDWGHEHADHVKAWDERRYRKDNERRGVDWDAYNEHMKWYDDGVKFRVRLRPQWTSADIASLEEDDSEDEAYRASLRELKGEFREYAPLMNRVASELNRSIFYGSDALAYDPETVESDSKLRETVKKFMTRCRKIVGMLGCASAADVHVPVHGGPMGGIASSSHAGRAFSTHAASSSRVVEEDEGEDDEEEEEEEQAEEGGDEEEEYDDDDGPPPTQPTQDKRGRQPKKDWKSPSPFQKQRPRRTKKPEETRSKRNEERTAKKGRNK